MNTIVLSCSIFFIDFSVAEGERRIANLSKEFLAGRAACALNAYLGERRV